MSKIKLALFIIVVIGLVFGVYYAFLLYFQPKSKPDFEISNFKGFETPTGYQIAFQLNNTGRGTATGVRLTIYFHQGSQIRNLTRSLLTEESTMAPGEAVDVAFSLGVKPTELAVTVVVECNEGVTREFAEFLPP
ncbi:MAG TPA: hypothetical protein ENF76_06390 [Candidatus Bathyarchaeota archaeon]|nr:hypothetical protein [Candidatus Bathyarchaeota archaeon]